jgi:hypothetical protein
MPVGQRHGGHKQPASRSEDGSGRPQVEPLGPGRARQGVAVVEGGLGVQAGGRQRGGQVGRAGVVDPQHQRRHVEIGEVRGRHQPEHGRPVGSRATVRPRAAAAPGWQVGHHVGEPRLVGATVGCAVDAGASEHGRAASPSRRGPAGRGSSRPPLRSAGELLGDVAHRGFVSACRRRRRRGHDLVAVVDLLDDGCRLGDRLDVDLLSRCRPARAGPGAGGSRTTASCTWSQRCSSRFLRWAGRGRASVQLLAARHSARCARQDGQPGRRGRRAAQS